jgi:hypothetical protein
MSFTSLPPELRITVYRAIIKASRSPCGYDLSEYQGLILASKQAYAEFEFEAVAVAKEFQSEIGHQWLGSFPLQIALPTRLEHCAKLHISIPKESIVPKTDATKATLNGLFIFILRHLPGFMMYIHEHDAGPVWSHDDGCPFSPLYSNRRFMYTAHREGEKKAAHVTYRYVPIQRQWTWRLTKIMSRYVSLDQKRDDIVYHVHVTNYT